MVQDNPKFRRAGVAKEPETRFGDVRLAVGESGSHLAGGRGGVAGPIVAVVILQLLRSDMTFLNVNTNLATVANGVILIGVVMFGSLIQMRRARA